MVCPSAWPAQGRRPAVCRLVSRQAYAGRGGGGGGLCRGGGYSPRSPRKLGFLRCKLRVFWSHLPFGFRVGGSPMNNTRVCHDE